MKRVFSCLLALFTVFFCSMFVSATAVVDCRFISNQGVQNVVSDKIDLDDENEVIKSLLDYLPKEVKPELKNLYVDNEHMLYSINTEDNKNKKIQNLLVREVSIFVPIRIGGTGDMLGEAAVSITPNKGAEVRLEEVVTEFCGEQKQGELSSFEKRFKFSDVQYVISVSGKKAESSKFSSLPSDCKDEEIKKIKDVRRVSINGKADCIIKLTCGDLE